MVHASRPGVQVPGAHRIPGEAGLLCSLLAVPCHAIVRNSLMAEETHRDKPLRLALIGMSGSGKTFWTKRLGETGRPSISCDDRIEQRLAARLASGGGHTGINGVAAWMGWPDTPDYMRREAEYLAEEIHTLDE